MSDDGREYDAPMPQAGRAAPRDLICAMVDARERLVYADAQYRHAEAQRKEAYDNATKAESAVKTIPELRDGGVIVMAGKAYMLRKPTGIWGNEVDPDKFTVEIRDIAE